MPPGDLLPDEDPPPPLWLFSRRTMGMMLIGTGALIVLVLGLVLAGNPTPRCC